jgi:O-antigen ligase
VRLVDLPVWVLAVIAVAIAALALGFGRFVSRRTGWEPAGGLAIITATPIVPHVPITLGLSLDDVLPRVGVGLLLASVDRRTLALLRPRRLIVVGLALVVAAALVSSFVHATTPDGAVALAARSAGRYLFLGVIVMATLLASPADKRKLVVARALAIVGTAEAVFGLAAFVLPLGIGLSPTRVHTILYLDVPGRIAGTLGISPNFLGAIFILTIAVTAGLALDSATRRSRAVLWASVGIQTLALTLTFTRASLGLVLVLLVLLVLARGRPIYLAPVALAVAVGFATTPALERLTADVPDRLALWTSALTMTVDHPVAGVGPGRTVVVARQNPERYRQTIFGPAVANAHNTILLAGAETGVAGALGAMLINVALAAAALRTLWQNRARHGTALAASASLAVLAYLVQGQVNNLFTVAASGTVFAQVVATFLGPALLRSAPPVAAAPASAPLGSGDDDPRRVSESTTSAADARST